MLNPGFDYENAPSIISNYVVYAEAIQDIQESNLSKDDKVKYIGQLNTNYAINVNQHFLEYGKEHNLAYSLMEGLAKLSESTLLNKSYDGRNYAVLNGVKQFPPEFNSSDTIRFVGRGATTVSWRADGSGGWIAVYPDERKFARIEGFSIPKKGELASAPSSLEFSFGLMNSAHIDKSSDAFKEYQATKRANILNAAVTGLGYLSLAFGIGAWAFAARGAYLWVSGRAANQALATSNSLGNLGLMASVAEVTLDPSDQNIDSISYDVTADFLSKKFKIQPTFSFVKEVGSVVLDWRSFYPESTYNYVETARSAISFNGQLTPATPEIPNSDFGFLLEEDERYWLENP